MYILVTGTAGFIGYHVAKQLLTAGHHVIGIDNMNDYYSPALKLARLNQLKTFSHFTFYHGDIADKQAFSNLLAPHNETLTHIIHLAAQAGVRDATKNPFSYIQSNLYGHANILEYCRTLPTLKRFIYASTSAVYTSENTLPFSIKDSFHTANTLYGITKQCDELLTQSYANQFNFHATGLRFFTVYGPWGRPDMAAYLFTNAIMNNEPLTLFDNGVLKRDFTYIDDIIAGIMGAMNQQKMKDDPLHLIYNLGNSESVSVKEFLNIIESILNKKAVIHYAPRHPGEAIASLADISQSSKDLNYYPKTSVTEGLKLFIDWYKSYHQCP